MGAPFFFDLETIDSVNVLEVPNMNSRIATLGFINTLVLFVSCLDLNPSNYNFATEPANKCVNRCTLPPVCINGNTLLISKVTGCDETQCQYTKTNITCTSAST